MTGQVTPLMVVVLLTLLSLAVIFLERRWIRLRYLTLLVSLAFFGFYNATGLAGSGWFQDIVLKLRDFREFVLYYAIILGMIGFTAVFGQVFCGWVCPMGAVQEFLHNFHQKHPKIPEKLDFWLSKVKYIFAIFLIGYSIVVGAKIHYINPFYVVFNLDSPSICLLIFAGALLLLSTFVYRPWCRWFCPFSAVFNILGRFSPFKIRPTYPQCVNCRLCERACRLNAIKTIEIPDGGKETVVNQSRCIRCGDCIAVCPKDAIFLDTGG